MTKLDSLSLEEARANQIALKEKIGKER